MLSHPDRPRLSFSRRTFLTTRADFLRSRTPLGRNGTPIDIAKIVSFLISPDGGWLTGQVLAASGGMRF